MDANEKHLSVLEQNNKRRELMLGKLFQEDQGMMIAPDVKNMRIANEIMGAQEVSTLKQMELDQRGSMLGEVSESVAQMFRELANAPLLRPINKDKSLDESKYDLTENELKEVNVELSLTDFQRDGRGDE